MYLSFDNKHLRKICEIKEFGIEQLGETVAKKLRTRLADIIAAGNIFDIIAGKPTVKGDFPYELLQLDLADNYKLLFCASNQKKHYLERGNLDWGRVNRLKLLKIERQNE